MQEHLIKRAVYTAVAVLLTLMVVTGFSAGSLFAFADTDEAADPAAAETTDKAATEAVAPIAEKARKAAADGLAAQEAAEAEAARQAVKNPLTGIGGYNEKAVGKRPAAVVVENDPKARPQWGIDDPVQSPDIILEGEMEGGETRTLWLYADITAIPSQVGPIRSARPPYVRFSELFDAIFIHCGKSPSSSDYVGADAVLVQDGVDHIDMLTYGEGTLFGRDYSRTSMLEHTAFLRGDKLTDAVGALGFRTDIQQSGMTAFTFTDEEEEEEAPAIGDGLAAKCRYETGLFAAPPEPEEPAGQPCSKLDVSFSSITPTKHWEYSETDGMYHSQDYYTDVARTNILLLFDETHYIVRANTWGSDPETYTNYEFAGGKAVLAYGGRVQDITWSVQDGKIVLTQEDGTPAALAPGKTWIGWCSSNHGGHTEIGE